MFVIGIMLLSLADAPPRSAEERALAYLQEQVPRWNGENKCYSCHNNGDAARALILAKRVGRSVPEKALADTLRWLNRPEGWDKNGEGDSPARDLALARIQFAAAFIDARDAGLVKEPKPLAAAAALVVQNQDKDGSWHVNAEGTLGSPATYGTALATHLARRTLHRADPERYKEAIAKADLWLRKAPVKSLLDASAVLMALQGADDAAARDQRARCLELIKNGERKEGGWGPYPTSATEPFDSAVVILALVSLKDRRWEPLIRRGRDYLASVQQKDGSWQETTRPAGAESYAQRLSTTGWATQALLAK